MYTVSFGALSTSAHKDVDGIQGLGHCTDLTVSPP